MAEVICFASSKGGSGKTTIAASLGSFLAEMGRRVLLIDCDEGTHGLTLMFLDEVNTHRKQSEHDLLGTFDMSRSDSIAHIEMSAVPLNKELSLFPAKHIFSDTEALAVTSEFEMDLRLIINCFRDDYDFILLDAQAGISSASKAAMSPQNSDMVILVSEYDPMSNAGIERLKARLPDELDVGRTWILLNKLLPEFVAKFSEFLSFANYLPPIPWTADVVRAYSRRRLALNFDDGNQFTLALLEVLKSLLVGKDQRLLEEWLLLQTERIKEPIEGQLEDTEKLIDELEHLAYRERERSSSWYSVLIDKAPRLLVISLVSIALVFSIIGADTAMDVGGLPNLDSGIPLSILLALTIPLFFVFDVLNSGSNSKSEREKDALADKLSELSSLRKRAQELRELASSNYEEIMTQRSSTSPSRDKSRRS